MPRSPRALVVAYCFPPHAAIGTMRTLRVVRRLAETGWDVTVLTGHPRTFRPGTPVDEALLDRVPPQVKVLRAGAFRGFERLKGVAKRALGTPAPRPGPGASPERTPVRKPTARPPLGRAIDAVDAVLAIPDHESGWFVPAVARGLAACRSHRPDVIYSSAPPWTGQVVAAALARLLRCPWVADFRDPWSRAPWREDRFRFAMRAAAGLEGMVVRRADRMIFVAKGNHDDFAAWYNPATASKFHIAPNGCDAAEFDDLRGTVPPAGAPFVLLHAGSLYAGRTPLPLLKAVAAAIERGALDRARFRLRFLGTVALESDLSAACQSLGIQDVVEFLPRVPRQQSLQAMADASALLLLQPGHTVSVPGKLSEHLAAGRPILAIAEGETAELVRESGIGVSVPPSNEAAIVTALMTVMDMAAGEVRTPGRELFDGTLAAAHIVDILGAVARGDTPLFAGEGSVHLAGVPLTRDDWAPTKVERGGL